MSIAINEEELLRRYYLDRAPEQTTYTFRVSVNKEYNKDIEITIFPRKGQGYKKAIEKLELFLKLNYPTYIKYWYIKMEESAE